MHTDKKLTRRLFVKGVALVAAGAPFIFLPQKTRAAAQSAVMAPTPRLSEFDYGSIQFADGLHQRQLDDTMTVLLNLSEDSLLKPFRLRAGQSAPGADMGGWYDEDPAYNLDTGYEHGFAPGHSFGQWISAFARAYAIHGGAAQQTARKFKDKAERLLHLYARTISPKFYEDFRWPSYTYDKLVCALMDAHQFTGMKDAFAILKMTTDTAEPYLPDRALDHDEMRARPHKNEAYCWDESYTLPENLFIVSNRGAGERYRQLAARFLKDATYFDPLAQGKNVLPDHHAYSYTNALSSAMQAYLSLGSDKHLRAAMNGFEMLRDTQSFATGGWGPDERFRAPESNDLLESLTNTHHSFETPCGSYAHFKLTRYLLRVTGNPEYGDSMEQVMYNTVLGAKKLAPDGHAFYYSDYNFEGKKEYHKEKWTCCSGSLPQVATDYRISTYFHNSDGIYVNLYIPSTVKWQPGTHAGSSTARRRSDSKEIILSQKSNYPFDEIVEFTVTGSAPAEFALHLRIPSWAEGATLKLNGGEVPRNELIKDITPGGFVGIRREWNNGDRVELELPMKLSLQFIDARHPGVVALLRGPLVLFAVSNLNARVRKEELLAAKRIASAEWFVDTRDGPVRLLPFTSITDEHYSTYFRLNV